MYSCPNVCTAEYCSQERVALVSICAHCSRQRQRQRQMNRLLSTLKPKRTEKPKSEGEENQTAKEEENVPVPVAKCAVDDKLDESQADDVTTGTQIADETMIISVGSCVSHSCCSSSLSQFDVAVDKITDWSRYRRFRCVHV